MRLDSHTPLTMTELGKLPCAECGRPSCDHELFLHASCHLGAPAWVSYQHQHGLLIVQCSVCQNRVATICVAP